MQSQEDAAILVFADSDLFDDRFWVHTQSYLGERVAQPIADNAKFVLNAVDQMMGSADLISLRAREKADRPFTVVEALRRQAEARFLKEEQALQDSISRAEARMAELQTRAGGNAMGEVLITQGESEEIARIRSELAASRAALREVERNLRRDIDELGSLVRFINVAAVPLVVALIAIAAAAVRHRRRKARVAEGRQ